MNREQRRVKITITASPRSRFMIGLKTVFEFRLHSSTNNTGSSLRLSFLWSGIQECSEESRICEGYSERRLKLPHIHVHFLLILPLPPFRGINTTRRRNSKTFYVLWSRFSLWIEYGLDFHSILRPTKPHCHRISVEKDWFSQRTKSDHAWQCLWKPILRSVVKGDNLHFQFCN